MFGNLAKALLTNHDHRSAHSRPPDSGCPMEKKPKIIKVYLHFTTYDTNVLIFATFLALKVTTTKNK